MLMSSSRNVYTAMVSYQTSGYPRLTAWTELERFKSTGANCVSLFGDDFCVASNEGVFLVDSRDLTQVVQVSIAKSDKVLTDQQSQTIYSFSRNYPCQNVAYCFRLVGDEWTPVEMPPKYFDESTGKHEPCGKYVAANPVLDSRGSMWVSVRVRDREASLMRIDTNDNHRASMYPFEALPFQFRGQVYFLKAGLTVQRFDYDSMRFVDVHELANVFRQANLPLPDPARFSNSTVSLSDGDALFFGPLTPLFRLMWNSDRPQVAVSDASNSVAAPRCAMIDNNGILWRGTQNELVVTRADTPLSNPNARVILRNVSIADSELNAARQRVDASDHADSESHLHREFRQPWEDAVEFDFTVGTLQIAYSLPEGVSPEKIRYSTRMVNLNDRWSEPETLPFSRFPALRAGKYRFEVKAVYPDGSESQLSTLDIVVKPPWYQTTWFYTSSFFAIATSIIGFVLWLVTSHRHHVSKLESEVRNREAVEQELRKSQQQLVQRERMKAIGEFVAGVSHDVNNLLSPILAYGELIQQHDLEALGGADKYGRTITKCATDASNILRKLQPIYRAVDAEHQHGQRALWGSLRRMGKACAIGIC